MRTYEIPVSKLAAALTHAAKNDVRFYLNGVFLDTVAGRIAATDGHRLFCGSLPAIRDGEPGIILPRAVVEAACKAAKAMPKRTREHAVAVVAASLAGRGVTVSLPLAGWQMTVDRVDGRFPDYDRVIPRTVSGLAAEYNPEYLADARDALGLWLGIGNGTAHVRTYFNGGADRADAACVVTGAGVAALAVVMPMRVDNPELPECIGWLDAREADTATAA
jgi:DNA polymerase-3 subunit beta